MADNTATPVPTDPTPIKPGYKTTEFWLATIATLVTLLYGAGVVSESGTSPYAKAIAFVAAALASLGYSRARGKAKSA